MSPIGPFAAGGDWYKGNLHTHSTASDGAKTPAEVCALYRAAGYDFVAITDHFLARFDWPIVDTSAFRDDDFTTLSGAEVHAPATRHGDLWHLLAVGLPLDFAPTADAEDGPSLARRCVDAGAFVAVAHPEWSGLEADDVTSLGDVHAVEVYNHTSAVRTDRGGGGALYDQLLARGRRPAAIAVDDAHFKEPDWFGGWVMVKAAANTPDALLAALERGHLYASQGPAFTAIELDGDALTVRTSPCARVVVLGAGAANAGIVERGLMTARFDVTRFRTGGWCRVVAVDEAGRRAWSGPITLA
jgi:hypothetical protein